METFTWHLFDFRPGGSPGKQAYIESRSMPEAMKDTIERVRKIDLLRFAGANSLFSRDISVATPWLAYHSRATAHNCLSF